MRVRLMRHTNKEGSAAILITLLLLLITIAALFVLSSIVVRELRAAHRIKLSLQAVQTADSVLECALFQIYKGNGGTGVLDAAGLDICKTAAKDTNFVPDFDKVNLTPIGVGFSGASTNNLSIQGVRVTGRLGSVTRALKATVEKSCKTGNPADPTIFWNDVPDTAGITASGADLRPDDVIGFVDNDGSGTFTPGDDPITQGDLKPNLGGNTYGQTGAIYFFPDVVVKAPNAIQLITSGNKLVVGGVLYSKRGGGLQLQAPDIDLRGGTVVTMGQLHIGAGGDSILGNQETILQSINQGILIEATGSIEFSSCLQAHRRIRISTQDGNIALGGAMVNVTSNRDIEIQTTNGNIEVIGGPAERAVLSAGKKIQFSTSGGNVTVWASDLTAGTHDVEAPPGSDFSDSTCSDRDNTCP